MLLNMLNVKIITRMSTRFKTYQKN